MERAPRLTDEGYLTTTEDRGHTVIRHSICNHWTTPSDVNMTFDPRRDPGE